MERGRCGEREVCRKGGVERGRCGEREVWRKGKGILQRDYVCIYMQLRSSCTCINVCERSS